LAWALGLLGGELQVLEGGHLGTEGEKSGCSRPQGCAPGYAMSTHLA
jgi:hypothetical protein